MKCPKCNYNNFDGAKTCGKCNRPLKSNKQACPKCAFKNDIEDKRCQKCGYVFGQSSNIAFNFFIAIIIVMVLYSLILLNKKDVVKQITFIFKIVAIVTILFIGINTLYFSKKNTVEMKNDLYTNERIKRLEIISKLALVLMVIALLIFSIYMYFNYVR